MKVNKFQILLINVTFYLADMLCANKIVKNENGRHRRLKGLTPTALHYDLMKTHDMYVY